MFQLYEERDQILLQKIREGDAPSFNELYKKYWKSVYDQAYKRLSDHSKAEDITQEIFCKIWINRDTLSIDNLDAYLFIAVRNKVLNVLEKEKRIVSIKSLLSDSFTTDEADYLTLQHEFLSAYKALVESLPSKRKAIFFQYYELGKSTEEIAEYFSLSQKTVQNQLGRAVTFLKSELTGLFILLIILRL